MVRIGIDVGGTHTKAIAIDNTTHQLIGKASVKTTHHHPNGVAEGVFLSFEKCLHDFNLKSSDVVFIAHSTTQATNAILEGDVAKVGLITTSKPNIFNPLIKSQSKISRIKLNNELNIDVSQKHLRKKDFNQENVRQIIDDMIKSDVEVIVSSSSFGVDDPSFEDTISKEVQNKGLFASSASDITKMYGYARRTKTAIINASIMPKMLNAIHATESKLKSMNVTSPLMIMRGDGGIMDVQEVKKRPVLTMLSGPAASVMGSMMYLQASNGIYFEVGGTSTNIGVIKNGRPAIDYAKVGNLETYVSSLDVKVLGVGGGSMVRAKHNKCVDIGPRSAHIASLEYACFTDPKEIIEPVLEFFSPGNNDPDDYVSIKLKNGKRITITTTCAANALGIIDKTYFAHGNQEAARKAIAPLAKYCNLTIDEVATTILDMAFLKVEKVIAYFIAKYKLSDYHMKLVGVGGGAASLMIHTAEKLNYAWEIPDHAEVISSIGVALAMVQDIVERVIPNLTKEDLHNIRQEVKQKAIDSGATEDTIDIHLDIDSQTQKVTAIATGSTEAMTQDLTQTFNKKTLITKAEEELNDEVVLLEYTHSHFIYHAKSNKEKICVFDQKGFNRLISVKASVNKTNVGKYKEVIKKYWEEMAIYSADIVLRPHFHLCIGSKLHDFSSDSLEHLYMLMDLEVSNTNDDIIVIATQ